MKARSKRTSTLARRTNAITPARYALVVVARKVRVLPLIGMSGRADSGMCVLQAPLLGATSRTITQLPCPLGRS